MTSNKARKSAVRALMAKTNSPYSVASRQLGDTPPVERRTNTTTVYRRIVRTQDWQIGGVAGDPFCLSALDLRWPEGVGDRDGNTFLRLVQQALGEHGWDVLDPPADDPVTDRDVVHINLIRNDVGLRLDRLPAQPACLQTERAAMARHAELMGLTRAELATMVRQGVRAPGGRVGRTVSGEPEKWLKHELATHIVHIERPDLPWALTRTTKAAVTKPVPVLIRPS